MKPAPSNALTVAGGLLLAFVMFLMTVRVVSYLGPVGRPEGTNFVEDFGGTDPWTGEFRPRTWTYTDPTGEQVTKVFELPDGLQNYRAVPLPVGFAVGCLLTLTVIAIATRRPRKGAPNSALSAA